ncbi:MAG: kynureninase [Panacagrimonas sp.]
MQPQAKTPFDPAEARVLDASDPLAPMRNRFDLPEGLIYLDGNSLGAMPAATPAHLAQVVKQQWGEGLVRSWNAAGWFELSRRLGERLVPILGAAPDSVRVCDSTSINLYKLLACALQLAPDRPVILTEHGSFPTDSYIAQGLIDQTGGRRRLKRVAADELLAALDRSVAVLMLSHVDYRSGAMQDLAQLTQAAHAAGALVLWDVSHSAGVVPLDLFRHAVDFAAGCTYKYLNGGPGAPAFLYVAPVHQSRIATPLRGWFGHARPFAFEPDYAPAKGIDRLLCGTPPILSMAAIEPALELWRDLDLAAVRAKSVRLTERFIALADRELSGLGVDCVTPREAHKRGSQVCLSHARAWPLIQALIARGVIGDFREPDILRFGCAPLYTRFADIDRAILSLREILLGGDWSRAEFQQRKEVT